MSATVVLAVVTICTAIFASITAPLILSHRTEKMHRQDLLEQYRREDLVAKKAEQAAQDLRDSQKAIADQAAEAARLLLEANERVAHTAHVTNGKLDMIHTLVNSNMTAAMTAELDATARQLVLMREVMQMNRERGQEPSAEVLAAIEGIDRKIAELSSTLADRRTAQAAGTITEQGEQGK